MGKKFVPTGTGQDIEVDDTWGPEEIQREIDEYKAWSASQEGGQSDIPQPAPVETQPTPETFLQKAGNYAKAIGLGTGRGEAGTVDWGLNIGDTIINDARLLNQTFNPAAPEIVEMRNQADQPATDIYDKYMPAVPKGYKGVASAAEMYGPPVLESLVSGGISSAAKGSFKPLKQMVPRVARDLALGVGGGEAGRYLAGEDRADAGALVGSLLAANLVPRLSRLAGNRLTMTPDSARKLSVFDRVNASLSPDEQIPLSIGLVGKKGAQAVEDVSGKVSSIPETIRARQIEKLEGATRNWLTEARGRQATEQISPPSIGVTAENLLDVADQRAASRISTIQDDLENIIGSGSEVDIGNAITELETMAANPNTGKSLRDQAQALSNHLQEGARERHNLVNPSNQIPPGQMPLRPVVNYGAIKDDTTEMGRQMTSTGQPLNKVIVGKGRMATREDMKTTAAAQGVPAPVFDAVQAETAELYRQRKAMEDLRGKTETATATKVLGGQSGSMQQMEPLMQQAPQETLEAMVDQLELNLRGPNAGLDPDPNLFKVSNFNAWRNMSSERKMALARNNPDLVARMDDIAEVGLMEQNRAGARTRPGSNNTMGQAAPWALGTTGAGVGWLGNGVPGAIAGLTLGLAAPRIQARFSTSPHIARTLAANKGASIADIMGRSYRAATPNANVMWRENPEEQARREEQMKRELEVINRPQMGR